MRFNVPKIAGAREADVIVVRGDGAAGIFDLNVDTRDERSQRYAAARLQRELDGYQGSAGDVAEYLRAIQTFAD